MESHGHVYGKWTAEDMERAVSAVHRGDMGTNEASRTYGIAKYTLSLHMTGKNKVATGDVKFHGHSRALPKSARLSGKRFS